jgi:hypothetical protein
MRKENVFLVTLRPSTNVVDAAGREGELVQRIVCAADKAALFAFLRAGFAAFDVVGTVDLASLEATVAQVKSALRGAYPALPVFVDPAMPGA